MHPAHPAGKKLAFMAAAATHVGCVREENQDDFIVRSEIGLWAVADGVGGLSDGRHASRTLVEALARIGTPGSAANLAESLETEVARANHDLRRFAEARKTTLGTTLVALLIHGEAYTCAWAGDSRLYLVREGRITLLTEDHTEASELIRQGILTPAEARVWPRRNVITRAIGVVDETDLEFRHGGVQDGDVFLLCSDGLTTHLTDAEILDELGGRSLDVAPEALVQATLRHGATDNVTAIIVGARRVTERRDATDDRERTVQMIPRKASRG